MKTLKDFDYDLWAIEENDKKRYFARVKATGEETEIDLNVMRLLLSQEKQMRREYARQQIEGTILSLNAISATQPSGKHRRQDYQEIETAYEELKKQDKKVSEDDALDSLRAAVRTMIRVCNNFIENFPRLVTEQAYKHKLVEIMQEAKSYIKELEGDAK